MVFFNGIKKEEEVVWEDYIDHQLIKWVRNNKGTLKALLFCVVVVFPPSYQFLVRFRSKVEAKEKTSNSTPTNQTTTLPRVN